MPKFNLVDPAAAAVGQSVSRNVNRCRASRAPDGIRRDLTNGFVPKVRYLLAMKKLLAAVATAGLIGVAIGYRLPKHDPGLPADVVRVDFQQHPEPVACPKQALVLLIAGQSNAANHGETAATAPPNILNFYEGRCYRARDPLLGASGSKGSPWTRLKLSGPVVLAPIAIGSSKIMQWTPGGDLWPRIPYTIEQLAAAGLRPDYMLWQQGEAEAANKVDPADYRRSLTALIRAVPVPVIVAQGTLCRGNDSPAIRLAQRQGAEAGGGIVGPNTDLLGKDYRRDGCHFNERGLREAGRAWSRSIAVAESRRRGDMVRN